MKRLLLLLALLPFQSPPSIPIPVPPLSNACGPVPMRGHDYPNGGIGNFPITNLSLGHAESQFQLPAWPYDPAYCNGLYVPHLTDEIALGQAVENLDSVAHTYYPYGTIYCTWVAMPSANQLETTTYGTGVGTIPLSAYDGSWDWSGSSGEVFSWFEPPRVLWHTMDWGQWHYDHSTPLCFDITDPWENGSPAHWVCYDQDNSAMRLMLPFAASQQWYGDQLDGTPDGWITVEASPSGFIEAAPGNYQPPDTQDLLLFGAQIPSEIAYLGQPDGVHWFIVFLDVSTGSISRMIPTTNPH
jgi:hypothetical protein